METVSNVVSTLIGRSIDADSPLMEAGLDSLGATEVLGQLQREVGEAMELPSTLVFEAPTIR